MKKMHVIKGKTMDWEKVWNLITEETHKENEKRTSTDFCLINHFQNS